VLAKRLGVSGAHRTGRFTSSTQDGSKGDSYSPPDCIPYKGLGHGDGVPAERDCRWRRSFESDASAPYFGAGIDTTPDSLLQA